MTNMIVMRGDMPVLTLTLCKRRFNVSRMSSRCAMRGPAA